MGDKLPKITVISIPSIFCRQWLFKSPESSMLIHLMFVFLNWNYHPCERFCLAMGCLMMFVRLHSCKPSFHISACHFCFHHRIPVSPWLKMSCTCHAFRSYVALLDLVVLWATLPSLSLKKSSKHILPCQTFRSGPQSFRKVVFRGALKL